MSTNTINFLRWSLLALSLAVAPFANAGLVYTADSRNLTTWAADDNDSAGASLSAVAATFDEELRSRVELGLSFAEGVAQQTSELTGAGVMASGAALAGGAGPGNFATFASGESSLFVSFESDTAFDFSLVGSVQGFVNGFGNSQALVSLVDNGDPSTPLLLADSATNIGSFSLSGRLSAGSYSLLAFALADIFDAGFENSTFDFTFATTAVPLPAGIWLLSSALLGVAAARRRTG